MAQISQRKNKNSSRQQPPASGQPPTTKLTDYRRRKAGFVFQFFNLLPTLTALENVMLTAEMGIVRAAAHRRAGGAAWPAQRTEDGSGAGE